MPTDQKRMHNNYQGADGDIGLNKRRAGDSVLRLPSGGDCGTGET